MKILHCLGLLILSVVPVTATAAEEETKEPAMASIMTSRREIVQESALSKMASGAVVRKLEKDKGQISYEIRWKEAVAIFNVDENYDQAPQNEGMLGWLAQLPKDETNSPAGKELKKYIPTITRSYGIVLPEGFDAGGVTSAFLREVARELNGYAFTDNCFYDASGYRVIGHPRSSPFFGRVGSNLVSLKDAPPVNELLAGKWNVGLNAEITMEALKLGMAIQTVDDFRTDGTCVSQGTATFTVHSNAEEPLARMGFNLSSEARWKIKDSCMILEDEKLKAAKPWCKPADFQEMLDGIVGELTDDSTNEPEEHWVICRDKNLILLQEKETGLTLSMKRKVD